MANILVLVSYKVFPAEMGGQKAIVNLYQQLSQHHKIHLAVSADNEAAAGFSVERTLFPHKRMLLNVFRVFQLKRFCRKQKIQLIIAEHSFTGWIAYLLKKITGIPFLIRSHNIEASRFRQMKRPLWRLYKVYERWIHRKADYSFFISEEDQTTAIRHFGLDVGKCDVISYGINQPKEIIAARKKLGEKFDIHSPNVFYFNGTLDYLPNRVAVENMINELLPRLNAKGLDFIIMISGKNLPADLAERINSSPGIVYLGITEDVDLLYQASTVFLNPIANNSGVKTKVIEALANHCKVVSMKDGAAGIKPELFGRHMLIAENGNWGDFTEKIFVQIDAPQGKTPEAFFDYFSAGKIALKAADKINFLLHANA